MLEASVYADVFNLRMSPRKTNTLSIKEKIDLINCSEHKKLTVKQLVFKFKCGKSQIYEILKNKEKIRNEWLSGKRNASSKRKAKITGNEEINSILYVWFTDARARNIPVSGPILQSQAKLIADRLGNTNFKASNGWLKSFRSRHNITFKQVETKDIQETGREWQNELKKIITGYEPTNIASCDEMGLFYKALPNNALELKNNKCIEGKLSKERLTVLLCGFADGKLEKPLVIGKVTNPRCFRNMDIHNLPVLWRSNIKAWMSAEIMENWLNSLNEEMKSQNRNILLFLDNGNCHPKLTLSNIKLCFFPANIVSVTQPMNQGVIQNFKIRYRKLVLQSLTAHIDKSNSIDALASNISALDAIRWIDNAYRNITPLCVVNSFSKAGFNFMDKQKDEDIQSNQSLIDEIQAMIRYIEKGYSVPALHYIQIDEGLSTEESFETIEDLVQRRIANNEVDEGDSEEERLGIEIKQEDKIIKFKDALHQLALLEEFNQQNGCCNSMMKSFQDLRMRMEHNVKTNDTNLRTK